VNLRSTSRWQPACTVRRVRQQPLIFTELACCLTCAQAQDQPRLWRVGPAPADQASANLEGARIIFNLMPRLSARQLVRAEGRSVMVTLSAAGGKPVKTELSDDSGPLSRAVRSAVAEVAV
jgi:hypothetical protein